MAVERIIAAPETGFPRRASGRQRVEARSGAREQADDKDEENEWAVNGGSVRWRRRTKRGLHLSREQARTR